MICESHKRYSPVDHCDCHLDIVYEVKYEIKRRYLHLFEARDIKEAKKELSKLRKLYPERVFYIRTLKVR